MDKNKNEPSSIWKTAPRWSGAGGGSLVDRNTGKVLEVEQTTRLVYGSKSFWKCYLKELVAVLKSLNSKQFHAFNVSSMSTKDREHIINRGTLPT